MADEIRSLPVLQYSIIMDGTRDVSSVEQEVMCLCYVDTDLLVHEDFIGFCEATSTKGKNLARTILDVLLRLNLPTLATSTIYALWSSLCQFSYTTSLLNLVCCAKCT